MLAADIYKLLREAIAIAKVFTESDTLRLTSEEGTDFEMDISDLQGI